MLFTIIGNIVALGAVAALVSAIVKKDRQSRTVEGPDGQDAVTYETQGTTAGRTS